MNRLEKIVHNNSDRTKQIKNWSIYYNSRNEDLAVKLQFLSGKYYSDNLEAFKITPVREMRQCHTDFFMLKNEPTDDVKSAVVYGEKFVVVTFNNGNRPYVYRLAEVRRMAVTNNHFKSKLDYFASIAKAKDDAPNDIPKTLESQVKELKLRPESALHAYFSKKSKTLNESKNLIYPFGLNLSQMEAVEAAFASQVSVIEGPPGTGKTQTILNIIANIAVNGQTAAIVSSNNAAVENVSEKMEEAGFGFLLASLGSVAQQTNFFEDLPEPPSDFESWSKEREEIEGLQDTINQDSSGIKALFTLQNRHAVVTQQVKDVLAEQRYYESHASSQKQLKPKLLPFYSFGNQKILSFMAEEAMLEGNKLSLLTKLKFIFQYGLYDIKAMNNKEKMQDMITYLQYQFYDQKLAELKAELADIDQKLLTKDFQEINKRIIENSMTSFKNSFYEKNMTIKKMDFERLTYKKAVNFKEFQKRYPIVLSTAFSLKNSIPDGFLFDYLIIDEASQLELVPGILALGCARNVVIVGDKKQLPHIPDSKVLKGSHGIEPCYDYVTHSMLHSISDVFQSDIPTTLLKEHYRCDPMIIKFCNEQYYDGELIPLTKGTNEQPLVLIKTSAGNHMRYENGWNNVREIESLSEEKIKAEVFPADYDEIGFIAPYRKQVETAGSYMHEEVIKDTVHKFQGRECDGIIFSTVLDQKSKRNAFEFVDDPLLLNVAISRAKKRFVLVSGVDVFKKENKEIAALIRYMEYYTEASLIHKSNVISVFDLLYKEFSEVLMERESKLKESDSAYKSERIIASLLRDLFAEEKYKMLRFKREYRLKDLISPALQLEEAERDFVATHSRCDFLIHFNMGNEPIGVIEVDGSAFHSEERQKRNDRLKDSILKKSGIPIIRLRTNESGEEGRVKAFLDSIIR